MSKDTPSNFKLKFTARVVDKIERQYAVSIEQLLGNTSVRNLAFFIEKAFYNEDTETTGVNNEESYRILESYLETKEKEDLIMDIMEALQNTGFLSRKIKIEEMRKSMNEQMDKAMDEIKSPTDVSVNSGKK